LIRNIGLPQAFLSLLTGLSTSIISIVRTLGPGTAINVLYILFRAINSLASVSKSLSVTALIDKMREISPNTPLVVFQTIRDCIHIDQWIKILAFPKYLRNIYNWLILPYLASICARPICVWLIKSICGLILSALAIIYNDTLYSIELLKQFADLIIDILNSVTSGGTVPNLTDQSEASGQSEGLSHNVEVDPSNGSFLSILAIVMLGVVTSLAIIMVADHYYPETTSSIPVISTIADSIHVAYHYISSYLFPSTDMPGTGGIAPAPEGSSNVVDAPESISRSSSGG
jgi:hypothetical protein